MIFFAKRVKSGGHRLNRTPVDLQPFRLNENSLLTQTLRCVPCPVTASKIISFKRVLTALRDNEAATAILRASPTELKSGDIKELFVLMEDVVEQLPGQSHYQQSITTWWFFKNFEGQLKDGSLVGQVKQSSRFPAGKRHRSNGTPTNFASMDTTTKVLDDFDSLEQRNSKSLSQARQAQEAILTCCERTFRNHAAVKALLSVARSAGLPPLQGKTSQRIEDGRVPQPDTLHGLAPFDQLRTAVKIVDRGNLHTNERPKRFNLRGLKQFDAFNEESHERIFELLLSERFLPRRVVVACGLTILIATGLNPEVLYSATSKNVRRQGNNLIITGLKGRTNGLVEALLDLERGDSTDEDKLTDARAIQALEMLLTNCQAIEHSFSILDVPLIVGLQYKELQPTFDKFYFYPEAVRFWRWHGHAPVPLRELRRLAAHVDYLSPGGSVYTVQALLNHKDRSVSVEYLNSTVIAELFEANIRRFMRKLEATALFRLGRSGELAARGLSEKDVQRPLFPVTDTINQSNRIDDWLANSGDSPLLIGEEELRHCIRQQRYYKTSYHRLSTDNPSRFVQIHLPRIIFCIAIRDIVLASPHAGLFRRLERE